MCQHLEDVHDSGSQRFPNRQCRVLGSSDVVDTALAVRDPPADRPRRGGHCTRGAGSAGRLTSKASRKAKLAGKASQSKSQHWQSTICHPMLSETVCDCTWKGRSGEWVSGCQRQDKVCRTLVLAEERPVVVQVRGALEKGSRVGHTQHEHVTITGSDVWPAVHVLTDPPAAQRPAGVNF